MFEFLKRVVGSIFDSLLFPPGAVLKNGLQQTHENGYSYSNGSCKILFPADCWHSARRSGVQNFAEIVDKLQPRTIKCLFALMELPGVDEIHVSSLWRPNSGPHTAGAAVDIGSIVIDGVFYMIYKTQPMEPEALRKFRVSAWETGFISQWIGPWWTNGVLGRNPGWIANTGANQLDKEHENHIHLTIA